MKLLCYLALHHWVRALGYDDVPVLICVRCRKKVDV